MKQMRIAIMLLIFSLCLQAPAAETNAPVRVPVAALQEIWLQHLDRGMMATNTPASTREWFCRTRLQQQINHLPAIEQLASCWFEQDAPTLAAAAMLFAQTLGGTNLSAQLSETLELHVQSIIQTEDDEPLIQTQVEMLNEQIFESRAYLNLHEVAAYEKKLRAIIRQSNDRREALACLIQLYELQREPVLPTLLSRLSLRFDSSDLIMVERYLQGLMTFNRPEVVTGFLMTYATQPGLDQELNQLMGNLCLQRGLVDVALLFLNRWTMQAPENPLAWQLMGQAQFKQHQYKQATRSLTKATKMRDHSPDVYLLLALISERSEDVNEMGQWLSRWHRRVGDDALLEALQTAPFNRYPRLLKEIE
ncbi:MAG: tetratricopeptide (TPR) repeat protein [Kiritimatiellia bacterium]|jgi:tetratricopeptide (TPR) repeat protein